MTEYEEEYYREKNAEAAPAPQPDCEACGDAGFLMDLEDGAVAPCPKCARGRAAEEVGQDVPGGEDDEARQNVRLLGVA